jgi:two-component system, response regulator RegA
VQRARTVLVVEDNQALADALVGVMGREVEAVHSAGTLAAARDVLSHVAVDALVLDVCLPDGQALELLEELAQRRPFPHVVAISGAALPTDAFLLAQHGVRAFVPKPIDFDRFLAVWRATLAAAPPLEPFVRGSVGHVPLAQLETSVRDAMVTEALAQAGGSRRGAARLLSISRQLLQHIVRGRGEDR